MAMSDTTPTPDLNMDRDKVCYVIVKARAFDVKDAVVEGDYGGNATDDAMIEVLEDHADDPTFQELHDFIADLNEDEQIALVALSWLGRGDASLSEWGSLLRDARDAHNERTAEYLLGLPLLGDYLEEGLSQFGYSCEDFETGHL
jgi:hypothetical protein